MYRKRIVAFAVLAATFCSNNIAPAERLCSIPADLFPGLRFQQWCRTRETDKKPLFIIVT